jgi:hypothetical protein
MRNGMPIKPSLQRSERNMNDYNIDDLFFSVNDIYTQFDEGEIPFPEAQELLVKCCKAFIQFNNKGVENETD